MAKNRKYHLSIELTISICSSEEKFQLKNEREYQFPKIAHMIIIIYSFVLRESELIGIIRGRQISIRHNQMATTMSCHNAYLHLQPH